MRSLFVSFFYSFVAVFGANAFTPETTRNGSKQEASSRRNFFKQGVSVVANTGAILSGAGVANAGPEIYNTRSGIKYAITKQSAKGSQYPQPGDIVAIDYTGYLVDGKIFDATHAEGKLNSLVFKLGSGNALPAFNDLVPEMAVGEKVQAIVPPELAFGDKGICLEESGECLIKPGSTLVYDITLKKTTIPPP